MHPRVARPIDGVKNIILLVPFDVCKASLWMRGGRSSPLNSESFAYLTKQNSHTTLGL